MKIKRESITIEVILYILVFFAAACLRWNHLGASPLSDAEANHALAAASTTPHASPHWHNAEFVVPSSPIYHNLTALLFHLFGAQDAVARFVNALAGLSLVLTPILARKRLGRGNTLLLAIVFCLSPILIAISRTAGSPSIAVLGIVSILMMIVGSESDDAVQKRMPWIAAALGFTLATGADALYGLLTISIAGLFGLTNKSALGKFVDTCKKMQIQRYAWIALVVWLAAVSGIGFTLGGFSGIAESIGGWFSGWYSPGQMPGITSVLMLPIYDPLVLIFGLVGIYTAIRNPEGIGRSVIAWFVAALFVMLIYPGRKPGDIVWVMLPMAVLASQQLGILVDRIAIRKHWFEFFMLSCVLIFFFAIDLMMLQAYAGGSTLGGVLSYFEPRFFPIIFIGSFIITALIVAFVGMGWDLDVALDGTGTAAAIFLILLTISSIWQLNFTKPSAMELWRPQATTTSMSTLNTTIEMISANSTGREDALSLQVNDADIHADIAWAMRDLARYSGEQDLLTAPELILTPEDARLTTFSGPYIGQSFVLGERWAWSGILPPNFIYWWITREAPISQENWILMARADLVPGATDIMSDEDVE